MELNAEGLPIKTITGSNNFAMIQTFSWQDGNVIQYEQEQKYNGEYSFDTLVITYDNKKNPMLYCKTPKLYVALLGDLLAGTFASKNNPVTMGEDFNIEYTYNEVGFPISRTVEGEVVTFKYVKK